MGLADRQDLVDLADLGDQQDHRDRLADLERRVVREIGYLRR